MMEKYIITYTGKRISALEPEPTEICLEDIAHALSMICRFNGHSIFFFSVAQHSIGVVNELKKHPCLPETLLYGLLHDAAEAYICDFPRPVKNLNPEYKSMEDKIQKAVWKAFKLLEPSPEESNMIKDADKIMLHNEAKILMKGMIPENFLLSEPNLDIRFVKPQIIEKNFLRLGSQLINEVMKGRLEDL